MDVCSKVTLSPETFLITKTHHGERGVGLKGEEVVMENRN